MVRNPRALVWRKGVSIVRNPTAAAARGVSIVRNPFAAARGGNIIRKPFSLYLIGVNIRRNVRENSTKIQYKMTVFRL
jgi:hypothetical protein